MGISDSKFCFGKLKTNKISAGIKSDADATLSEKTKGPAGKFLEILEGGNHQNWRCDIYEVSTFNGFFK